MTSYYYIADGDSITAGAHSGGTAGAYPALLPLPGVTVQNNAVSGQTINNSIGRESNATSLVAAGHVVVGSTLVGYNDFTGGFFTVSTFLTKLQQYFDDLHNAGVKTVGITLLPSTTFVPTYNNFRNSVNSTIRTWVGTHIDGLADLAANNVLGSDTAPTDHPAFWTYGAGTDDGIHPGILGQQVMAEIVIPVVWQVLGLPAARPFPRLIG